MRELVTAAARDDWEYAYGLVTQAEATRFGRRETRPLNELICELEIAREELDGMPDQPV